MTSTIPERYVDWCRTGANEHIIINKQDHLTYRQLLGVLLALRNKIADGMKCDSEDSDEVGNKHTTCTWGLCTDDQEVYNDNRMHVFPKDFDERGRMTPLVPPGPLCPMQRVEKGSRTFGCFYQCRVFRPTKSDKTPPSREEALKLYDQQIKQVLGELAYEELRALEADPARDSARLIINLELRS